MDHYIEECKACYCKRAREALYYDVYFNCNTCPYAECAEPETRELYLAGVSEREIEYREMEEAEKRIKMRDEEYKRSDQFAETKAFADEVRKKIEGGTLLDKGEFARALRLSESRDARLCGFYSFADLVRYQLAALGYEEAADEICGLIREYFYW
jgi:hypothetical protein